MGRPRRFVILLGAAAAAVAVVRHGRGAATGRRVPGGIIIGDAVVYDALSRLVLGSLFGRIAADVAAVAPDGARVLEVGCGPGRLSIRLARQHGLEVTGLDLDPAMIERARANADRPGNGEARRPSFLVGDVASLAFPDGSFDLVVSTLSMHHWADPTAGLAEIGRVLRPSARPDPTHAWHSDSYGNRDAMALALEVPPHPADRAGPRRRLTRTPGNLSDIRAPSQPGVRSGSAQDGTRRPLVCPTDG